MPEGYEYRWREPVAGPAERGSPSPRHERVVDGEMLVERNLEVPMRDGTPVLVDVFRPADEEQPVPPLIAWAPYGKHAPTKYAFFPGCGLNTGDVCRYAVFEGPEPSYWVARDYAVVHVDPRGTWHSPGDATFISPEEAQDYYDLVEWAGTQPWSNGNVGLTGVSYLAVSQWRVAELKPPHLQAINPWEGWTDTYREVARHGGVPETWFWPFIQQFMGFSTTRVEDFLAETEEHPVFDAFWESKAARPELIEVPAFVVASWGDQGMHLRGTVDAFRRLSSTDKWLDVHGRKKWAYYYAPENKARLKEFFDHFLKGADTEVTDWPRVRLEVRERHSVGRVISATTWPLPETEYERLYLDPAGTLRGEAQDAEAVVEYHSLGGGPGLHRAVFEHTFSRSVDLVGTMRAKLFMSDEAGGDMDVFVGVWKLGSDGAPVYFPHYQMHDDGPVALGWIRASHRELDPTQTTEARPVLSHREERPIVAGEVVELDIEIWPSGTHFDEGEGLLLVVQGTDQNKYPPQVLFARHEQSVNRSLHRLHLGGTHASYLQVPVVAAS